MANIMNAPTTRQAAVLQFAGSWRGKGCEKGQSRQFLEPGAVFR